MKAEVRTELAKFNRSVGRVIIVDRVIDAASGMFGVRIELNNPNYRLPAGLRCKVKFYK